MKKLLAAVMFLVLQIQVSGQIPAFPQSEPELVDFSNHIGLQINTQRIRYYGEKSFLPVSLIYKRQLAPNHALRFTAAGYYRKIREPYYQLWGTGQIMTVGNFSFLQTMAGYEWQLPLSKRWLLFAGTESGISRAKQIINYDLSDYRIDPRHPPGLADEVSRTLSIRLQPFVGMRFQIQPRLYLAAEVLAPLSYNQHQDQTTMYFYPESAPRQMTWFLEETNSTFVLYTNPSARFQLAYQF